MCGMVKGEMWGWWGEGLFLVKKTLWTLSSAAKSPINVKLC